MAANPPIDPWPIELIADGDAVFYRVHKSYFVDGVLNPGVFQDRQGGMSTDWSKYSTAQEALLRARTPVANGIMELPVKPVRDVPLGVDHRPIPENRAHSEVIGAKDTEARVKLGRIARWIIPIQVPPVA